MHTQLKIWPWLAILIHVSSTRALYADEEAGLTPSASEQRGKPASKSSSSTQPLSVLKPTLLTPIQRAREMFEKSEYEAAEREVKTIRGQEFAQGQMLLARIAYTRGQYAEAERIAKKTVSLTSKKEIKLEAIAWQARAALAVGRIDDAFKLVEPLRDEPKAIDARALLVEIFLYKGDRDEARSIADALESDSENENDPTFQEPMALARVGQVAHWVRHIKFANSTFQAAMRLQKKHVETNLLWAQLFLDYYDPGHAEECIREIIEISPNNPYGHLLKAELKLGQNFDLESAEKSADQALKINPNLVRAYFIKASIALHDLDIKSADDWAKKGLQINPNDLELLSLRSAIRYLDDDQIGFEQAKNEVFKRNPKYSRLYGIVGEFAEWEHRYDDLVTMMQEAVKLDDGDSKAWANLGFNLLRRGDEKEGLAALEQAYKRDKYNVRLVNTLNLFEKTLSQRFDLLDGTGTAAPFRFRLEKEEVPVLGRYMPTMFGKAWGQMVKKYGFTPKFPVQIEVFPDRQQFSIRTDGVPNIGPTGVCFGRLITAVSPKNESSNWGLVLWHELAHVFAIQLSKNHVPRWFTEGLSEYETIVTRPEWRRALDSSLYLAIRFRRLPKIAEMNRAFTRAKSTRDMVVAYYAASQMILYIVETYGFPKIVSMLQLWGQGQKTIDVIQNALGISADELDEAFRAWALRQLRRYDGQFMFDNVLVSSLEEAEQTSKKDPKNAQKTALYAAALMAEGKPKEAEQVAKQSLTLDSNNQLAHYIAAKTAFGMRKDVTDTLKHVEAIQQAGGDGYTVQIMLADLAQEKKDKKALRIALEKAANFDPSQSDPLLDLYKLAEAEGRTNDALQILRKMSKIEPHERLLWRILLIELVKKELWDEAISVAESALYVDVYSAQIHASYAHALIMKNRLQEATREIEVGFATKPKPEHQSMLHVEQARLFIKQKQSTKAKEALDAALKMNPKNQEAIKMKAQLVHEIH